ncbi:MAG TPA: response regulator [Anaeromyxobacter sp.]|nr:response regulator [Anaeromyxobacter sp.]
MPRRIGDLLVESGAATVAQVEAAARDPHGRSLPLASRLLASGVDEARLASALAVQLGMPGVDLSRTAIALEALEAVPLDVARADLILPLSLEGGRLHLAMARPLDERVISEVRFVTGREVSAYAALRGALDGAIAGAYEAKSRGEPVWRGALAEPQGGPGIAAALPEGDEPLEIDVVEAELLPDEEAVVIEVGAPEPHRPRAGGPPLVLVVDDEPDIRRLVQRTLTAKGYQVELAVDGEEALAKADALLPDLVLLDAMLPKVHGFEACRRIKASPRTRNVPVVMMTAIYRGWRFAQDAKDNYGAEDYVEKPFRIDDLLQRMEAARAACAARAAAGAGGPGSEKDLARGRELLAAGRVEEAAQVLARAAKVDPRSADVQYQLGRALRAKGDAFGAMTALERAAELRPGHLSALRALAALYLEKGFRNKAVPALERALAATTDEAGRTALLDELDRLRGGAATG